MPWNSCEKGVGIKEKNGNAPVSYELNGADPDHVAIVIHNYRWRLGLAEGGTKYDDLEKRLAASPVVNIPTITLEGDVNGAPHPAPPHMQKIHGQPSGPSHGVDIDEQGYGIIEAPRTYQLIRQVGPVGEKQFEIEFLNPSVEIHAFTFG